jgi:hypothetical protein
LDFIPGNLQNNYTNNITRAEFAALSVQFYETVMQHAIVACQSFNFNDTDDVNVEKAATIKIVDGMGNGIFDPNGNITREQAAVMLSRLADAIGFILPHYAAQLFDDDDLISVWAKEAVMQMRTAEIINGMGDNKFAPQNLYTREQSIVTIMRLFDLIEINIQ